MARTFSFNSAGRLSDISGAPTGADASNVAVVSGRTAALYDNPSYTAPEIKPEATFSPSGPGLGD
jgi:hypothetical protein